MRFIYIPLLLIFFTSCSKPKNQRTKLLDYAPANASVIIKASNLETLKNGITNNDLLQRFSKTSAYANLQKKLSHLSLLNASSEILLCFSNNDMDSLDFSIVTRFHKGLIQKDSLKNYIEETLKYDDKLITQSTLNNNTFYSTLIDSTFFASSSKQLVENVYTVSEKYTTLEKVFNTTSNDKTLSFALKPNSNFVKSIFIEDTIKINHFTDYIVADVELNQDAIYFNGITKAEDSTKSLINIFKNTIPQENQTYRMAPSHCDGFMSFTFDDFKTFHDNLTAYAYRDSIVSHPDLFNDVTEIGIIYQDALRTIILNTLDVIATGDALLNEQTQVGSYRGVDIFSFSNPELFAKTFTPLVTYNNARVYCIIDSFFIFAEQISMLQEIIASYQNKTTLADKAYFKSSRDKLSDASSLLQIVNNSSLKTILDKNLDNNKNYSLKDYDASGIQFIYDNNFAHVNGIIKKVKTKAKLHSVSEQLNIKLSADILTQPHFVKNHITKQKEIVVQDVKNNLYLISNKGKILWKKQLDGAILGEIKQIDIYKNGRLQLAFATPHSVYVLDRNGNEVSPFSLKFKDEITQPLAVFDYDKRKNYRLMVTQGKRVLMYNTQGNIVKGFGFKAASQTIIAEPKHFRIGSKDYLTLKTKRKIYILDRVGKTRIKTNNSYKYSNQPIFLFKNKFTTTTQKGQLISIDTRGRVSEENLSLSKGHFLETSSKTLVTLSENKLSIKNKTTELDFGDYTSPKLFYINDKIHIATTDLQSHKIYLFDSQSKLFPNFPVYGNSTIVLDNIDSDKTLEFVTKGERNSIILYQIN